MENYQQIKCIGKGAFGKAWLVKHKREQTQYVIKEIPNINLPAKEREQSKREVAVLSQMNHPNIVRYCDSFESGGNLHIVMEFCDGGDLFSKISAQRGVLFNEEQVLDWFVQIALAMKHLHDRKILHRDLKSQNIFLMKNGRVKLGDFGIVKVLNSTMDFARTAIGTPYYMSPEIFESRPYNNKSDIWSLGCVLYEVTTLKHAFEGGNMSNLALKIIRGTYPPISPVYSYEIRNLVSQLLKKSPRERPHINAILRKPFISRRIERFLSREEMSKEFSHTIMHGNRVSRAPPRPNEQLRVRNAARPVVPASPKPGAPSPAAPVSRPGSKPGQRRYDPAAVYGAKKVARASPTPGPSPRVPTPDQRARQQREEVARRHKEMMEKQRREMINRARESGWKNVLSSSESDSDRGRQVESPKPQVPSPIPGPACSPAGDYKRYHEALDRMKEERERNENRPVDKAAYMDAPRIASPNPMDAARVGGQAQVMGAEAAQRARVVEEFLQRKREAAMNKHRGNASPYAATPVYVPQSNQNKEQEEYLEKLRQIRMQNFHDRRNLHQQFQAHNAVLDDQNEERRKKIELLKKQAEERAQRLKQQLEEKRVEAMNKEKERLKQMKEELAAKREARRDDDEHRVLIPKKPPPVDPAPPVLHRGPSITAVMEQMSPSPSAEASRDQQRMKKENILKRLNAKKAKENEQQRGRWAEGPVDLGDLPLLGTAAGPSAQPAEGPVDLGDLPLLDTAAGPSAQPAEAEAETPRKQWRGAGDTMLNLLAEASLTNTQSAGSSHSEGSAGAPEGAAGGRTVTLQADGGKAQAKGKEVKRQQPGNNAATISIEKPSVDDLPLPRIGSKDEDDVPRKICQIEEGSENEEEKEEAGACEPSNPDETERAEEGASTVDVDQLAKDVLREDAGDTTPKKLEKPECPLRGKWQSPAQVVKQEGEGALFKKTKPEAVSSSKTESEDLAVEDFDASPRESKQAGKNEKVKEVPSLVEDKETPGRGERAEEKNENKTKEDSSSNSKKTEDKEEEESMDEAEDDDDMELLKQSYQNVLERMDEEEDVSRDTDDETEKEDQAEDPSSASDEKSAALKMQLTLGKFDVRNATALRTCSLPDLTKLFDATAEESSSKVKRASSTEDYKSQRSNVDEDADFDVENEEKEEAKEGKDEEQEEETEEQNEEEEDEDMVTEEEYANLESVRQSMKTVLELPDEDSLTVTDGSSSRNNTMDDVFGVGDEADESGEWDEEDNDDDEDFGDEAMAGDDVFLRLERLRSELEEAVGGKLLLQAYNIVQSHQEDEEDNEPECRKAVHEVLGEEKMQHYDSIVQLVLADVAFMEG